MALRGAIDGNEGAPELIHARTVAVFAPADRARDAELDRIVKDGGRCRYCGKGVSDVTLARTPGLCSQAACKRLAKRDARFALAANMDRMAAFVADLPSPPVEPTMASNQKDAVPRVARLFTPQPSVKGVNYVPMTDKLCLCGCGKPIAITNKSGYRGECQAAGRRPSESKRIRPRLRDPEAAAAVAAAPSISGMTEVRCACEPWCGHFLRKNNTTGYSGYCSPPKVEVKPAVVPEETPVPEAVAAPPTPSPAVSAAHDFGVMSDEALVALLLAARAEAQRRREAMQKRIAALTLALAEAA